MTLAEEIKARSEQLSPELKTLRRHLHQHPELSFKEHATQAYLKKALAEYGLAAQEIAGTGLIVDITGNSDSDSVFCLRADIDALPIEERTAVPFKSKNQGVMHACGHDVHTSCVLGASIILKELASRERANFRILFQPGEEKLPGGATLMIRDGALENPVPFGILGQHVMPELEVGKVGFRPGLYMASCDEIHMTVIGKGGHGALPHTLVDPVLIASHIVVALQQIVSRKANASTPSVLSFGNVEANGATNVIPSEVKLQGTFRTYNEEWRDEAHAAIIDLAQGLAKSMGGDAHIRIERGYPFLKNHEGLTKLAKESAIEYLGAEQVVDLDLRPTGEDFAFYSQLMPACFYRLGVGNEERGISASVHSPNFDVDEEALTVGCGLLAYSALMAFKSQIGRIGEEPFG